MRSNKRLSLPPLLHDHKVVLISLYCDEDSSPYVGALASEVLNVIDTMEVLGAFGKGIYKNLYVDDCAEPDLDGLTPYSFKEPGEIVQRICRAVEDAWNNGTPSNDPQFVRDFAEGVRKLRLAVNDMQLHRRVRRCFE